MLMQLATMKGDVSHNQTLLESLLRRGDVWRGHSQHFVPQTTVDTGYEALNMALLHKGWPLGALIEICQKNLGGYAEWQLLTPALLQKAAHYIVLLNPPAFPFAQRLLQIGFNLDRLLVVQAADRANFLSSFIELARSQSCHVLMAWQPKQRLSYTDLRKCLLTTLGKPNLYVLFRHADAQQQSSPASLRILSELQQHYIQLHIFKQKGSLLTKHPMLSLPLPEDWQGLPAPAQTRRKSQVILLRDKP